MTELERMIQRIWDYDSGDVEDSTDMRILTVLIHILAELRVNEYLGG